jgi:cobyric acid synthase
LYPCPGELGNPRAIVLPGSKSTLKDLQWLKETGLAELICKRAASGVSIGGICGGYQMMGRSVSDPQGIEGPAGTETGLGLVPADTTIGSSKTTVQTRMVLFMTEQRNWMVMKYIWAIPPVINRPLPSLLIKRLSRKREFPLNRAESGDPTFMDF